MIPKDLCNLIESYNEHGIMISMDINIYWFNGKRYEFWCKKPNYEYALLADILYHNNILYYYDEFLCKICYYNGNKFQICENVPFGVHHFAKKRASFFVLLDDGSYIRHAFFGSCELIREYPNGTTSFVIQAHGIDQLILYKDVIYIFANNLLSFKYNWKVNQTISLNVSVFSADLDLYCINDRIYGFNIKNKIALIFNLITENLE